MTSYKNKNEKKISLQSMFIGLIMIYCIIFPADKINIKEILLGITLIVCFPQIQEYVKKRGNKLFFWAILYPFITTIVSLTIGDSTLSGALSYGYVWIYLLLIPPIVLLNIDIKKTFIIATTAVAIIVDFIYVADMIGFISIYSNPLISFFSSMHEIQWGKGVLATFGYSIFYKSSPLIIFTYGYMLYRKKYIWASILFLSFIASGTRANFLIATIVLVLIPLFCSNEKPTTKMIITVLIIGVAIYTSPYIIERFTELNELKYDRSEEVKIKAVYSIFDHMNAAPYRYVFGSGVGSFFYSSGRNAYVDVVEVSFFDYFRQVGSICFLLFLGFLVGPMKWLFKNQRWMLICFLGYLAIAFTNPLLVTSTSFMAYVLIMSNGMGDRRFSLLDNTISENKDLLANNNYKENT